MGKLVLPEVDPRIDEPDAPGMPTGLVPEYDLEDLRHPGSRYLELVPYNELPPRKSWGPGAPLNQDGRGACVGFSVAKWYFARPRQTTTVEGLTGNALGFGVYDQALILNRQQNYFGEGTSLHNGARVADGATGWRDRLTEYVWFWGFEDATRWLLTRGGLVIGIPWHTVFDGVRSTTSLPTLPPPGTSGTRGYHALFVYGANRLRAEWMLINSWGSGWGYNGRAKIMRAVLEEILFSDRGAGCMGMIEAGVA